MIRLKILLLSMLCIATFSQALLITSDSIKVIENQCEQKNCMIFLDLDETIGLRVFDPTLKKEWINVVLLKLFTTNPFDQFHFVQKLNPMEPTTIPLLNSLQDKNVPIFIITARPIRTAEHTKKQLKDIGFDASQNNHFKDQIISPNVVYKDGIIYCSSQEKGPILLAFLRNNNLNPDKIIFADNRLDHAQSVDKTLTNAGIDTISAHYTREKLLPYFSSLRELF